MKKVIVNLLSLPYRAWGLWMGYRCLCDECHTIVSGGFGNLHNGKHTFQCMDCAQTERIRRNNRIYLNNAMSIDPTNKENN